MAEVGTGTGSGMGQSGGAGSGGAGGQQGGPGGLDTEKGNTTIAEAVVNKVAGIACREVGGVHALGGGVARALGGISRALPGSGDNVTQGVTVEVGETEAAVDVKVVVEYGESIPKVAQQIRENVIRRIEGITGLRVAEVNIAVDDLHLPGEDDDAGGSSAGA